MKFFSEKNYHLFFRIGVWLKGIIAVGELATGLILSLFSYASLYNVVNFFFGEELNEAPKDIVWNYLVRGFQNFSTTPKEVWAFIFLSHGLVKIFLVGGLLKNKLWAYPSSAVVFTLFIFYQIYQYFFTPSFLLIVVTIFDVIVTVLILHEYKHKKRKLAQTLI